MTEEVLIFQQAEQALRDAAEGVVEEARRTNGVVVVWENGAVRHIQAAELPPPVSTATTPTMPNSK
jgi:hypothetical protein